MTITKPETVEEILSTAEEKQVNEKKLIARTHCFGSFVLRIVPKSDSVDGSKVKWRKGMNVEGTLSFKNEVDTIKQREFVLHSCQAKSVANLFRSIFSKAWSNLYQYAEITGATEFKITYLKYRIKKAQRWVDHHVKMVNLTNGKEAERHRKFVIDNATTEKTLTKRLNQILESR